MDKTSTMASSVSALERTAGSADWSRWTQNRWVFYDYVRLNPLGTNRIDFFNAPIGQLDPISATAKSLEQTNINEVRSFGRVSYLIKSIRTHIRIVPKVRQVAGILALPNYLAAGTVNPLAYAMEQLSRQGVLLISLGQKEYFDIPQPFINAPAAFGPDIRQVPAVGANLNGAWFQQQNDPSSMYVVKPEQLVEAGQTIQASMVFENGNTPVLTNIIAGPFTPVVEIGLILDGFILRPVQ